MLAVVKTGKRNIGKMLLSRIMAKKGSKKSKKPVSELEIGGLGVDFRSSVDSSKIEVLPSAKTTWSGYIEVLDRKERLWISFRWDEGEERFTDQECHRQLCDIAELFKRDGESLKHILFGVYQTRFVASTTSSSLRDLLFLNPPSISIVYNRGGRVKGFALYFNTNFATGEHLLTSGIGLTQIGLSAASVAMSVAKGAVVTAAVAL